MEDEFEKFYFSLDKNAFKYFVKDGGYYIYDSDIDKIDAPFNITRKKGLKEIKIDESVLETTIKNVLVNHKLKVEGYEGNKLCKEGFPGNWKDFTDILLEKKIPPSICSIKLIEGQNQLLDVSFLNTSENIIYTCKIEDDDVFSNLYSILSEINAFEVIYDCKKLDKLFDSIEILKHFSKKGKNSFEILADFLKIDKDQCVVREYIRPNICRLDSNVLEALNIYKDNEKSVYSSFYCYTNQGYRLLLQFIKHPLKAKDEIENRLEIVDEISRIDLKILKEFPDLLRLTKRISNLSVSIQEIIRLNQIVYKIPNLIEQVSRERLKNDFYIPLTNISNNLSNLQERIEKVIDIDASKSNIFRVKLSLSTKLGDLNESYAKINKEIQDELVKMRKVYDKIKFEENTGFFKVTRAEYRIIEEKLKEHNVLIVNILKTGVNFTTKNLSELNLEKENIFTNIQREEKNILNELKVFLKDFIPEIEILNYITALLDVFNSFATKSKSPGYSKPTFGNKLVIKEGFHPVLENMDYIVNDIELDKKRTCIITGPNMGGKSTFLKTIGVISILAQIGCYVPCKECILNIFDGIYIRVGANDCSYTGNSTFMLEMMDISRICRMSTSNSLVLIDELGRGTSEVDGLSIAQSVRDYLIELNSFTLFATHFPELCDENVVCKKAKNDGLLLLYKIVDGVCDTSFGINVAEKVGFPNDVIEDAKRYIK